MFSSKSLVIILGWAFAQPLFACNSFKELQQGILKVESDVKQKMINIHKDATRVLVVGTTGGGKTTLIYNLLNVPLFASEYEGQIVVSHERKIDNFNICHDCNAGTTIPQLIYDGNNNCIYCDCPGFFDTRGAEQEIINLFAINQLFSPLEGLSNRIKIILVMSEGEFRVERGGRAKEVFLKVCKLIPDMNELKTSIVFVLSKADKSTNVTRLFKWLSPGFNNELVTFLVSHPEKLFTFFQPEESDLNNEVCINSVGDFIKEIKDSPVINPRYVINLSSNERALVVKLAQSFNIQQEIIGFSKDLILQASKIDGIDLLCEWRLAIFRLRYANLLMPEDLIRSIKNMELFNGLFEKFLSKMSFLNGFYLFCNAAFPDINEKCAICPNISNILEDGLDFCYMDISNLIDMKKDKIKFDETLQIKEKQAEELKKLEENSVQSCINFTKQHEFLCEQHYQDKKISDENAFKIRSLIMKIENLQNDNLALKEQLAQSLAVSDKYQNEIKKLRQKVSQLEDDYSYLKYECYNEMSEALKTNQELKDKLDKTMGVLCYDCQEKVRRTLNPGECSIL